MPDSSSLLPRTPGDKRSEAVLRQLFDLVVTNSLDGIVVLEAVRDERGAVADFVCRLVNPKAEEMLGFNEEELLGKRVYEQFPRSKEEGLFEQYVRVIETGEPYYGEVHYDREDVQGWFDVTAARWAGGVVVEFHERTAYHEAQSELEESAQRFRLLAENVSDVLVRADADGAIQYVSPASRRVLDLAPEEVIERSGYDFVHPDDEDTARRVHKEVLETGESAPAVYRVRHGDGGYRWMEARTRGIRDADSGEVTEIVAALRDVTERRQTRQALEEAKEEAEAANRAKSQFLANMSHELRTPLNAVIGYSEMLHENVEEARDGAHEEAAEQREQRREQFRGDLERIHRAGKQLLNLVNDVLDIAKIEAGEMGVHPAPFEVAPTVQTTAETIEPLVEQNGNRLEVDCPQNLGTMHTDKTKLRQTLFNLLGNAAKFTEDGRVTLRVRRYEEDGRDWVRFAVEDTGIGISEAERQKLFKAFAQVDTSLTREHEGTGLGLIISRNLCRMMGGRIELESEKGVGSTFTVHLPARLTPADADAYEPDAELTVDHADVAGQPDRADAAPEPDAEADAEATPQSEAAPAAGGGVEAVGDAVAAEDGAGVLVIDDDPQARDLIGRQLEEAGFDVATAASGRKGMEKARHLHPAVITLDVMMPEMDGWAVLTALQRDEALRDIPVVMVTIVEDEDMGYMLGADDYLTKPLDADRLVEVVQKHQPSGGASVLVVEDDELTRELIRRTLEEEESCTVREAANGRVALALMEEEAFRPDAIILDLMMPEVDGFAFLEALRMRVNYRPIPVIVVTAKDLTAEERERLRGEVDEILQKGNYDREELLTELHRHVSAAGPA